MTAIAQQIKGPRPGEGADSFELIRTPVLIALVRKDLAGKIRIDELARRLIGSRYAASDPAAGRGRVSRLQAGEIGLVVRPFLRGGLAARINSDVFFRLPPLSSFRMFGELRVLSALSLQGANVPRPAGAVVQPMITFGGASVYRGLIMTEELPQTGNFLSAALAACRTAGAVPAEISEIARRAGCEARRCLDLGVFHPDLHPGNVLFDPAGRVYLIDFDKAKLAYDRPLSFEYRQRTSQRWNRSIQKHGLAAALRVAFEDGLNTPV